MGERHAGRMGGIMGVNRLTPFHEDDGGFTQLGVVVALLLTVSLLLTASQAYWVRSNAADIQQAADAGALAAGNVVDGYLVVARVADALVLSLSLLGLTLYAASAVAACIPFAEELSVPLSRGAAEVLRERDRFCDQAIPALDRLQSLLPFLCAENAALVITANATESPLGPTYIGLALPVPLEGASVGFDDDAQVDQAGRDIAENDTEVQASVDASQRDAEKMKSSKAAGFHADCDVSGSQWERASVLADLSATLNPLYTSEELWGFEVAIARARAYYSARIVREVPTDGTIEAKSDSVARLRFYRYALDTVSQGSVNTSPDGVTTVDMPFLPQNTEQMRETSLYTEHVYPLSSDGSGLTLHSCTDCPGYGTPAGTGALSAIDEGTVQECQFCRFSIGDLGKAPAASTSIENGFEYHYKAVAEAARDYSEASRKYAEDSHAARETTSDSLDSYEKALRSLKARRFDPQPPGRYGCVAVVFDAQGHGSPQSLGVLTGSARLGPRVAVSACMLAPEDPTVGANVITSLLDGLVADAEEGASGTTEVTRLAATAVGVWGDLLLAYLKGTEGLEKGTQEAVDAIPGVRDSALAGWARDALGQIVGLLGLQPVKMESYRPVLVNTSHVLERQGGLADVLGAVRTSYEAASADYVLATVTIVEGLPGIEVKLALPASVSDGESSSIATFMQGWGASSEEMVTEGRRWR